MRERLSDIDDRRGWRLLDAWDAIDDFWRVFSLENEYGTAKAILGFFWTLIFIWLMLGLTGVGWWTFFW